MIYRAREREATTIPLSEVSRDGYLDIFPEVEGHSYFDVRLAGTRLIVTAGKYIGLIPLNDRVLIEVLPKTPIPNLLHILSSTEGDITELKILEREYREALIVPDSILTAMARALVRSLQKIEIHGLLKRYDEIIKTGSFIKGRLVFSDSLRHSWSHGLMHRATSRYHDLTADISENQILRFACYDLLRNLSAKGEQSEIMQSLYHFEELFATIGVSLRRPTKQSSLRSSATPDYDSAQKLATAIISRKGIELSGSGTDITLPSFLVDMETLFERYLRTKLQQGLAELEVLDGNREGAKPLFDDRDDPNANPDIVITKSAVITLVGEVKYKPHSNRADLNQVLTYALSYGVTHAVIFLPTLETAQAGLKLVGTVKSIDLYSYSFNLAAADLGNEEAAMCSAILGLHVK